MSMYCEMCGHRLTADDVFCPNCGHNVRHTPRSLIYNIKNYFSRTSGAQKAMWLLLVCIFGLMIANGVLINSIMHDVTEPVNDNSYSSVSNDNSYDTYTSVVEDNPSPTESSSSSSSDSSSSYSQSQDSSGDYASSGSGGSYVASSNSNKFHYSSCGHVNKIKSGNLISFSSREEAIAAGYSPCKSCSP